jgi:SAM-dependent methyltransferase
VSLPGKSCASISSARDLHLEVNWQQRFARLVTRAVVRQPALWKLLRRPLRGMFDRLAPTWSAQRPVDHLEPALARVDPSPRRILDLGTGTGRAASAVARRWPDADVVGVDLAPEMIAEARRHLADELASRVRFEVADAARLPYSDGAFDLVVLANMIPFFDELARVVAPGGTVVAGFSSGERTPIYVPPERLRDELGRRGFGEFAEFAASGGIAFLARKPDRD